MLPSTSRLVGAIVVTLLCSNTAATSNEPIRPIRSAFLPNSIRFSKSTFPAANEHHDEVQRFNIKQPSDWSRYKIKNNDIFEHTAAAVLASPSTHKLIDVIKESHQDITDKQDYTYTYPSGRRARSIRIFKKQATKLTDWHETIEQIRYHHQIKEYLKATKLHEQLKDLVQQDLCDIEKDRAYKRYENPIKGALPPKMKEIHEKSANWKSMAENIASHLAKARQEEAIKKYFPSVLNVLSSHVHTQLSTYKQEVLKYRNQAIDERFRRQIPVLQSDINKVGKRGKEIA